jgi:hypothetical protein
LNERQYKDRVAALGCLICGSPAELHHPRKGQGKGQRAPDWLVVPLCEAHHRTGTDYVTPSVHGAPQDFRAKYGDEMGLVAQTIESVLRQMN